MGKLKSFNNDKSIKNKYLEKISSRLANATDEGGKYLPGGNASAVELTIGTIDYAAYEIYLGIPLLLARLKDRIFQGLTPELALTWPRRFLEAIPVGVELSSVWPRFAMFLLEDRSQSGGSHPHCKIVRDAYVSAMNGVDVDWEQINSGAWMMLADTTILPIHRGAAYVAAYAAHAAASASHLSAAHAVAYASAWAADRSVTSYGNQKVNLTSEEATAAQANKLLEIFAEAAADNNNNNNNNNNNGC